MKKNKSTKEMILEQAKKKEGKLKKMKEISEEEEEIFRKLKNK